MNFGKLQHTYKVSPFARAIYTINFLLFSLLLLFPQILTSALLHLLFVMPMPSVTIPLGLMVVDVSPDTLVMEKRAEVSTAAEGVFLFENGR